MAQEQLWWAKARELRAKGLSYGQIGKLCGKDPTTVIYALSDNKKREKRRAHARKWWAKYGKLDAPSQEQQNRNRLVKRARDEARDTGRNVDEILVEWGTYPRRAAP